LCQLLTDLDSLAQPAHGVAHQYHKPVPRGSVECYRAHMAFIEVLMDFKQIGSWSRFVYKAWRRGGKGLKLCLHPTHDVGRTHGTRLARHFATALKQRHSGNTANSILST